MAGSRLFGRLGPVSFGALIAASLATAIAACGGKVVVDGGNGDGDLGNGGSGAGSNSSGGGDNGEGGFGQSCMLPPDPTTLTVCGGTGSGGQCETDFCDPEGNTYAASCEATTCVCTLNGAVKCTCALNGPGDFCGGTQHCCPWGK